MIVSLKYLNNIIDECLIKREIVKNWHIRVHLVIQCGKGHLVTDGYI